MAVREEKSKRLLYKTLTNLAPQNYVTKNIETDAKVRSKFKRPKMEPN